MLANLTIRKGGIYYLGPEEDQGRELRARTFLAIADQADALDINLVPVDGKLMVILSISRAPAVTREDIEWAKVTPVNSGSIDVAGKAASWMEQPGRVVLLLEPHAEYRDYLDRYFETPHRWLAQSNPIIRTEVIAAVQAVRRQSHDKAN